MIALGLIPARGGSVGVPRKNIRALGGLPLISWTIMAARSSGMFERIVVTTDDADIAEVATKFGAEVPFLRPSQLATATASAVDVVSHSLEALGVTEAFAVLQPTSPFRNALHLREAVSCFEETLPSAVIGVALSKPAAWQYSLAEGSTMVPLFSETVARRQDAPPLVHPNGSMYITTVNTFETFNSLLPDGSKAYEMGAIASLDIDEPEDFDLAEAIVKARLVGAPR